jgi:TRAP-type C4-dicarboxylate transport system permease small subunit
MKDWLERLPRLVLAALMVIAIVDLLLGVFLRYVMVEVTDFFDWPTINFVWVEEVGELALAWIALVGAAIGIRERTHFTLDVVVHRFSANSQRVIGIFNALLIAVFGALTAWFGWKLAMINTDLESPALSLNLAWLYSSAVVGGILIVIYALALAVLGPKDLPEPGTGIH